MNLTFESPVAVVTNNEDNKSKFRGKAVKRNYLDGYINTDISKEVLK